VHHAYLFSGPRGCGKTSAARILARSLNCAEGPTPTPCGRCPSCVALAPNGPGSLDVIEIDAASHGLVDDARDLRERAVYAPVTSRFKVYIVDEAHMVTPQGFNALLKLVEEPPAHVKFVFATTAPDKVIGTIRSRTFHYPFRLVPGPVLKDLLADICRREGATVDPLALPLVVRAGAGSARDCLSVLDQLLAGCGDEPLDYARAIALLGYTDATLLDDCVDAVAAGDGAALFRAVERVIAAGHDPDRFVIDLLERFRDLIVLSAVPDDSGDRLVDLPLEQVERLRVQAGQLGPATLSRCADLLAAGLTEMRGATSPRLLLELLCARLVLPAVDADLGALASRVDRLERRIGVSGGPVRTPRSAADEVPARPPAAAQPATHAAAAAPPEPPAEAPGRSRTEHATPAATDRPPARGELPADGAGGSDVAPVDVDAIRRLWPDIVKAVGARRRAPAALLTEAQVASVDGGTLVLAFTTSALRRLFSDANSDLLREVLRDLLGVDWQVRTTVTGAPSAGVADPEPDPIDLDVPSDDVAGPAPSEANVPAEQAAVALLQGQLGARVVDTPDATGQPSPPGGR
jgi:DNA polymerase-3 subunit gamma/tau